MSNILEKFTSLHCDVEDILQEEVEWNREVKDLKSVIDWFIKYVDDSNCLDLRELQEYHNWCQDGHELQAEYLDDFIAKNGSDVKKFSWSDLTLFDLELLNEELDTLKIQDKTLSDVLTLSRDQVRTSMIHEQILEKKLKAAQLECQKEGQNLMKINVPLKSTLSNLVHSLSYLISALSDAKDPDIQNIFLSNAPLDSFIFSGDKFIEYTNQFLKQEFKQPSSEKQSIYELSSFLDHEQSIRSLSSSLHTTSGLPNKMWKLGVKRIAVLGTLSRYNAEIKYFESVMETGLPGKLNMLQMQLEMDKFEREISRLTQEIDFTIEHEAANLIEDLVLCYIIQVTDVITKARINRRKLSLRKLCSISNKTNKFLYLTDLLWMLFNDETQRIKVGTELLKEFSYFLKGEFDKHKATMDGLSLINNKHRLCTSGSTSGQFLFMGVLQRLANLDNFDNDSGNGTFCESASQLENQLRELDSAELLDVLQSHEECHSIFEEALYSLCLKLTDGPTKKPSLIKKDLNLKIQEIEAKLQECCDEFDQFRHLFTVKQKSIVAQNRRLLWAWFIVAPEKLEKALSQAEKESRGRK